VDNEKNKLKSKLSLWTFGNVICDFILFF